MRSARALLGGLAAAVAVLALMIGAATIRGTSGPALFFAVLGVMILMVAIGGWILLALDAVGGAVWPIVRRTVVAGGLVKASYYAARLARPTFERDPDGGAALAGALALLHRPAHDPALQTWLEGKVAGQARLGLAGVVATGLLAASRGDRPGARDLMLSADNFDPELGPVAARQVANEWLVADAAERGDWATVIRRGVQDGRATAYTRFLARAAARIRGEALAGEPNPTDIGLWLSWLLVPGRTVLRPLLDQARAAPRVLTQRKPPPPPADPPPPLLDPAAFAGDPIAHAQALHALWLHAPDVEARLTATRLQELCAAWEAAWKPAERRLVQRAQALTAQTKGEALIGGLKLVVADDLARLARAARLPLAAFDDIGPTGAAAAATLRRTLLDEVEQGSEHLRGRTKADRRLPAPEELREWNALRRKYEEAAALGGMELRYLLFPIVHRDACNYAVWLWNERKEYGISGPIFRWLLTEAEAVGDQEAIALQRKNVGVDKR